MYFEPCCWVHFYLYLFYHSGILAFSSLETLFFVFSNISCLKIYFVLYLYSYSSSLLISLPEIPLILYLQTYIYLLPLRWAQMPFYPSSRLWYILFLNFYYDSHWGFAKSLRSDLNCGLKSFSAVLTLSHYPIFCLTDHSVFVATMSLVHSSVWTCSALQYN